MHQERQETKIFQRHDRQRNRETGRHRDTETQRHRDTVSEKCLSMSLKILDPWDNLGSHLDQTNKE